MASDPTDTLTWLHISDVHMGLDDPGDDRHAGIREYLKDLRRVQDTVGDIDLVLFTGDLTQSGTAKQFADLDAKLLAPLYEVLRGSPPLLAVPGNHDLQWATKYAEKVVRKALCDDPTELWERDESALEFVRKRFAAFDDWWVNHPRRPRIDFTPGLLPGDFVYVHRKGGANFGIAGLNTAALHLHGDVKPGELGVHKHQLVTACDGDVARWLEQQHVNLLLTHHPPDWIRGDDLDGGLRAADFHVHLFGHMHEMLSAQVRYGSNFGRRTLQAASLFGRETYWRMVDDGAPRKEAQRSYGYAVARIERHESVTCVRLWPRRGFRQPDGRWRIGPDGSFALRDDILFAEIFPDLELRSPWPATTATLPPPPVRPDLQPWPQAVETHPLWDSATDAVAAWRERCVELVRRCRAVWDDSARVLEGASDPWRDVGYPVRILERLAASVRERLSAPQLFLLLGAPFVHEAAWAAGLERLYRDTNFEDLNEDPSAEEPRLTLQRMHRAYPRVVRLAERRGGTDRRTLALWLLYRALTHLPRLCDARSVLDLAAVAGEAYAPLMELWRCVGADAARILELHRSDRVVVGAPVELGRLGALLASASAAALDVRTADDLATFHVGGAEGFTIEHLLDATNAGTWQSREDTYVFTHPCADPIQHFCIIDLVRRADATTKAMRNLPHNLGRGLPPELSATGVVPAQENGRACFQPIHVRFQLDHNRIRDLLMGRALYRDSNLALRELYQNALDACRYCRARTEYLRRVDSLERTRYVGRIVFRHGVATDGRFFVECEDDGVGMSQRMLEHVFAVAGQRFHDQAEFLAEKERWEHFGIEYWPNSQHGIGVLSYFMLADEVELETREFRRDGGLGPPLAVRITSASGLFHVRDGDPARPSGTRIRLYLQEPLRSPRESQGPLATLLRRFLVVAEFATEVIEDVVEGPSPARGRITHRWSPGIPDHGRNTALTASPDLWWSDDEKCPVLADGIATQEKAPYLLVNLRGARYPTLSADRKHIQRWDKQWIELALLRSGHELAHLPELWLGLVIQILCEHPVTLEHWDVLRSALPPLRLTPPVPIQRQVPALGSDNFFSALATTRNRRLRKIEVRPERLDFLPADALLFEGANTTAINALAAWRIEAWRTALGELWPTIYLPNPRLPWDTRLPSPELGLALSFDNSNFMVLNSPPDPVEALASFTGFVHMQARVVAGLQWGEERLGLPLIDLSPTELATLRERDPEAATLTDVDINCLLTVRRHISLTRLLALREATDHPFDELLARVRQLAPMFRLDLDESTCQTALAPQLSDSGWLTDASIELGIGDKLTHGDILNIQKVSRAPITTVLQELESLSDALSLSWAFDPQRVAAFELRQDDRILLSVDLDGNPPWLERRVPFLHLLFASRRLEIPFEQLAARASALAEVFALDLPTRLTAPPALTKLEWRLLSRDLDGELPCWHGAIRGQHVVAAMERLQLPIAEITAMLARLADPLELTLEYDRSRIEALDPRLHLVRSNLWFESARGLETSLRAFLVVLTKETSYAEVLVRARESALAFAVEVRPSVRFILDPSCDALAEQLCAQPPPYDGFEAGRAVRLWVLQAACLLHHLGGDIDRALLCAGRWWLWWLSDERLSELGRMLHPVLAAEGTLPAQLELEFAPLELEQEHEPRWTRRK